MTTKYRVLLLGAGMVAGPCVDYLLENDTFVTVADLELEQVQSVTNGRANTASVALNASDEKDIPKLKKLIDEHDLLISLLPAFLHPGVAELCIAAGKHCVNASYISPKLRDMNEKATKAGVTVLGECGLDPGIDHMAAMKMIHEVQREGGVVKSFVSFCGGLPAPEDANVPLGYKFSWSPRGVLNASNSTAIFLKDGKKVTTTSKHLMASAEPKTMYRAFNLEGIPNRDSTLYCDIYGIQTAHTCIRGTLRYTGFCRVMQGMKDLGLTNPDKKSCPDVQTWLAASLVVEKLKKCELVKPEWIPEVSKTLRNLGMYDKATLVDKSGDGSIADAMAALMAIKLAYTSHQHDAVILHHTLDYEDKNGKKMSWTASLVQYGVRGGTTAMALTVGIPAAIGALLILKGTLKRKGVFGPLTPDIYDPALELLEKEGIFFEEFKEEVDE